jgi:23S rRNA pseudouridine1911/1915/1917 synthase
MAERYTYIAGPDDEGLYIREIIRRRMDFSSRLLKKIKYGGEVLLDGNHVKLNMRVRQGELVELIMPEESSYFEPEDVPFDIAYEDPELMIVNKPPGVVVHPTKNYQSGTLANGLAKLIAERIEAGGTPWKIRFVNRLDRDTSGLLIVAKAPHAQDFLDGEMKKNRVVKEYLAIVHGITEEEGTIDRPIDKDPNHVARRMVRDDGYPSVTHYKRLEAFPAEPGTTGQIDGYSLVRLRLDTGRTHQIRVHMTHIGHPLLGDELYGQLYGYDVPPEWMPRQALHAARLSFDGPDGRHITAEAPLPKDFMNALKIIGREDR